MRIFVKNYFIEEEHSKETLKHIPSYVNTMKRTSLDQLDLKFRLTGNRKWTEAYRKNVLYALANYSLRHKDVGYLRLI